MKTNHTPEPWKADEQSIYYTAGAARIAYFPDSYIFIAGKGDLSIPAKKAGANASRTAMCVNACAGLNPEAIPEMVKTLEFCSSPWTDLDLNPGQTIRQVFRKEMMEMAQAAIAKAKAPQE